MNKPSFWFYPCVYLLMLYPFSVTLAQPASEGAWVRTGRVELRQVRERRTMSGQVEPARRSLLTSELEGLIVHAPPEPGVEIKLGQVLARLESTLHEADVAAEEAGVREAAAHIAEQKAILELTERNLVRYTELHGKGAVTQQELDDTRSAAEAERARYQLAVARHDRAEALLSIARHRLSQTQIKAPFAGFVVRKNTELGQWLQAGQPICELVDIRNLKVRISVPEAIVSVLPKQEPITVHFTALHRSCEIPIFSIVPDGDANTRTFTVLFKMDNEDGTIQPGMSVRADLPTGKDIEALTIHRDALRTTPSGTVVFAERGGISVAIPVTLLFAEGDRFAVMGELKNGDRVVVEGHERVEPGSKLRELPAR